MGGLQTVSDFWGFGIYAALLFGVLGELDETLLGGLCKSHAQSVQHGLVKEYLSNNLDIANMI